MSSIPEKQTDATPSVLTKNQKQQHRKDFREEGGNPGAIIVQIRHDDDCGNGRNTFSMAADLYGPDCHSGEPKVKHEGGKTLWCWCGGCCHDEIRKHFPNLAPHLKWHLSSTDGPMHYVANSLYWAGKSGYCDDKPNSPPNEQHFRSTAVWDDAPWDDVLAMDADELTGALQGRLTGLMTEFRAAVESLGLNW